MKKTIFLTLAMILFLTACGNNTNAAPGAGNDTQFDPADRELPLISKLVIGTFQLEDTDYAVTAEQAAELLPLWQVYQSLSTSDTAAQEERDALVEQIQDAMTAIQMQAIEDMQLTQEDMFAVIQEHGGMAVRNQDSDSNSQGSGGFTPPEGGFAGGGPGGGGGFPGGDPGSGFSGGGTSNGQNLDPEQVATAQAARGGGAGFDRLSPMLLEALIQFLEERAGM